MLISRLNEVLPSSLFLHQLEASEYVEDARDRERSWVAKLLLGIQILPN